MGFREIPAEFLEKIFGKNGCMEVIFGTLLKVGIAISIGYLGLRLLISKNPVDINTNVLPSPTPVLTTPTFLPLSSNTTPTETNEQNTSNDCIFINIAHPNAFRAWLSLGKPESVIFFNLAGPDGNPEDKGVLIYEKQDGNIIYKLPRIVHYGDKFCKQK